FDTENITLQPGLGLTGYMPVSRMLALRPQLQVGYKFNSTSFGHLDGITLEVKLGFGLNPVMRKKRTAVRSFP
ncbi:MAG: hypothetical protein AAGB22_12545, partial [Bacteroidota bacterium]